MSKKATAQVWKKDGTFVQVRSWKELERLAQAGEIDVYSPIVADDLTGVVADLERDFFDVDSATVASRVLAIVAVVLALALGVAILVKGRRSSTENADSPPTVAVETVETIDFVEEETDDFDPFGEETDVADPFGEESDAADALGSESDAVDALGSESDAVDALGSESDAADALGSESDAADALDAEAAAAERLAVELGRQLLAAAVFDEAKRDVFRNVADAEANLKKSLDEKKSGGRLPTPLRKRTAYPGLEEREVGILLKPEFETSYAQAIKKTPFSFFEFVSSEKREANFDIWGGSFATNPYAHDERLPGPSPHVLPNATQPFDLFYYDARLKREYINEKKAAYVEKEKARIKKELAEKGQFPKDEEIKVEPPEDKDVVAVERWSSLRELYDEMRETAALLDAEKFDEGLERLNKAQERLSFSAKNLRTHVRVKAVFSIFYYYLKAIEIRRLVVAGQVTKAEVEFVNLTNSEFFKEQYVGFQLGVFKDFAGLLVKCGYVDAAIPYLEYLRGYCPYVYLADAATSDDRRKADIVAASLAWDLIYIYERQGKYRNVVEIGEPLWQARANGRSAPAANALFDYNVKEMRKHLAIAYWNIDNKATATRIFEDYLKERQNDWKNASIRDFWSDVFNNEASDWREAANRANRVYNKIAAVESGSLTENVDFEFAFCRANASIKSALYWGDREKAEAALDDLRQLADDPKLYQVHIARDLCELGAALYSYGCWEDAEYCYRKAWLINAATFNDPNTLLNWDALLGIAATQQARGRRVEAEAFLAQGLEPMLNQLIALRFKSLDGREASAIIGEKVGEWTSEGGEKVRENAETMGESLEGTFWQYGGALFAVAMKDEQRNVEEKRRLNTPERWIKNWADECYKQKRWGYALLLYKHWQTKGELPGASPSELESVKATAKARIAECETKLREETI